MYLFGKRAELLETDDINRLILNEIKENKTLEYKRELSLAESDKMEFLFDVTAMHNTDGGCIIYGIEERKDDKNQNTGIPAKVYGITIENYDKLEQQIEDIIKSNTEPSLSRIAIKQINIDGVNVLVIGIPQSLGLPTMVTFKNTNKFLRRRNSGKYTVDVYELNQMFMQNRVLKESVEKFRLNRIEKVVSGKVFPTLERKSSIIIQIIPFSFLSDELIDLSNIRQIEDILIKMKPLYTNGWDSMYNLDGFATFSGHMNKSISSYVQLFRNGIIEIYSSGLILEQESNTQSYNYIYESHLYDIFESIKQSLTIQEKLEIESPFFICISLHGIYKSELILNNNRVSKPFMTDEIFFPSVLIPNYETDIRQSLKPIFDMLWQAAGWNKSLL